MESGLEKAKQVIAGKPANLLTYATALAGIGIGHLLAVCKVADPSHECCIAIGIGITKLLAEKCLLWLKAWRFRRWLRKEQQTSLLRCVEDELAGWKFGTLTDIEFNNRLKEIHQDACLPARINADNDRATLLNARVEASPPEAPT